LCRWLCCWNCLAPPTRPPVNGLSHIAIASHTAKSNNVAIRYCASVCTSGGPKKGHVLVFSWLVFLFTIATKTIFLLPESVRFGLHGDVLAARNGWVAASHQLGKLGFPQFSRFTTILVLIRDTRVNDHPEGKELRKNRPDMLWGCMSTAHHHTSTSWPIWLPGI
jgi:hypothetical protein